jgi:transcriptional regulator with XRE-family HTH domain
MGRTVSGRTSLKQSLKHIDEKLGHRIRVRRRLMRMNQQTLAQAIGVSFQALQKYEAGENRVSASALLQIARVLNTPISYFFEDLDQPEDASSGADLLTLRLARAMNELPEDVAEAVIRFAQSVSRARDGRVGGAPAEAGAESPPQPPTPPARPPRPRGGATRPRRGREP